MLPVLRRVLLATLFFTAAIAHAGTPSHSILFVNGPGNLPHEAAAATFAQVTSMSNDRSDLFPEPRHFDRKTLALNDPDLNGNALNILMPWMNALDGTGGETLNDVGRHEVGVLTSGVVVGAGARRDVIQIAPTSRGSCPDHQ